jgi:hypothetical protein
MTDISEQVYKIICQYCGNCTDKKCLADVPWYCGSIHCGFFTEEKIKGVSKKKRSSSMKRILGKTLVETF